MSIITTVAGGSVLKLTAGQISILSVLEPNSGLMTGRVSTRSGAHGSFERRTQSAWVRIDLLELFKNGLVSTLNDRKPVCWIITEAGLVALAAATENKNVL